MKDRLQAAVAVALTALAVPAESIAAALAKAPVVRSKRPGIDYQTAVCLVLGKEFGLDPLRLARVVVWRLR